MDFWVCENYFEHVKLLLQHGAPSEVVNNAGRTPVQSAFAVANRKELFQLLVDAGAKTEKKFPEHSWAFELLCRRAETAQAARIVYWIVKKRLGRDMARVVAQMVWDARWK